MNKNLDQISKTLMDIFHIDKNSLYKHVSEILDLHRDEFWSNTHPFEKNEKKFNKMIKSSIICSLSDMFENHLKGDLK